jgi:hypothetical protein
MRGPKNHQSSPPKMRWLLGIRPTWAGEQPWLVSVATVKDCGAMISPKRLSAAQRSS